MAWLWFVLTVWVVPAQAADVGPPPLVPSWVEGAPELPVQALAQATRRQRTARHGAVVVLAGVGVAAFGAGTTALGLRREPVTDCAELFCGPRDPLTVAGLGIGAAGLATLYTGLGIYTISSLSAGQALRRAGRRVSLVPGVIGVVAWALGVVPGVGPASWVVALAMGGLQATTNRRGFLASWAIQPRTVGHGAPGIGLHARF